MFHRALAKALLAGLFLAVQAPDAGALELGPLTGIVEPGTDEPWTVSEAPEGGAILENASGDYAITYFYVNPEAGEEGKREITLDVGLLDSEPDSMAGILYGLEQEPLSYFLFAVGGDRSVNLYFREPGSFEQRMGLTLVGLDPGKVTLGIREYGNEIALLVNGVEKSRIGNDRIGKGAVGIAAAHTGKFVFRNFAVAVPEQKSGTGDGAPRRAADAQVPERATPQKSSGGGDALRLKPVEVYDTAAPFGKMLAFSTLVPADWETQGGIVWYPVGGCQKGPRTEWVAMAPDKKFGVAFLPAASWGYSNFGQAAGCINQRFEDAESYGRYLLTHYPGIEAQILEASDPPELRALADQLNRMYLGDQIQGMRRFADSALLRVRASDGDVETDNLVLVLTMHWEMGMTDAFGRQMQSGGGGPVYMLALSTPVGELDEGHPAIPVILKNFRVNPAWNAKMSDWWAQQNRTSPRPSPAVGAVDKSGESVLDIMHNGYRKRQGMIDSGQAETIESVWTTETYATPDGDRSFSSNYDQAWRLKDGTYVLTNDAFFDPYRVTGQDGDRLSPTR